MDVVITWVDGDAPVHRAKRAQYSGAKESAREDIAAPTRFRSVGEIYLCVRSILKFAPFVDTIFIVTDQQDPHIDHPKVKIIDHRQIFRGYEDYLPTFNSISITSMLWRIPDLGEEVVLFNDDVFLFEPIEPTEWFENGKVVIRYGHWASAPLQKLLSLLKPRKGGKRPFGFKDAMYNAARKAGLRWRYFKMEHTAHPFLRAVFERFDELHNGVLENNASFRFRNPTQFSAMALGYIVSLLTKVGVRQAGGKFLYMKPVGRGENYVERKIRWIERHRPKMGCIQSLDMATESDQRKILNWLENRLTNTNE